MIIDRVRNYLDLLTFHKTMPEFINENRGFNETLLDYGAILFVYAALTAMLLLLLKFGFFVQNIAAYIIIITSLFLFANAIAILSGSAIAFVLAKLWLADANFAKFFSIMLRIAAAINLLLLVLFIPFADFAKIILFFLAVILSFYFTYSAISEYFSLSTIKSAAIFLVFWLIAAAVWIAVCLVAVLLLNEPFGLLFNKNFIETTSSLVGFEAVLQGLRDFLLFLFNR